MSWRWTIAAALCLSGCDGGGEGTNAHTDSAYGDRARPVSPPPLHDLVREHAEELGIRPNQVRAIRRLADNARTTLNGYHRDIDTARDSLRRLLEADRPDRVAVRKAIRALGEAETKLREGEIGVMLDIFAELEPGQRRALGRKAKRRPRRNGPSPPRSKPQRKTTREHL